MPLLRALALLLVYPDAELIASLDELEAELASAEELDAPSRQRLLALIRTLRATSLLDLQEDYVDLFDRTRALSLHLYEHVHGDARQRGQAMADLVQMYRDAGLELQHPELPDYLPVLLEFLSVAPEATRASLLGDAAPLLGLLGARLRGRGSDYAAVLETLATLGGVRETVVDPEGAAAPTLEQLDAAWAEAPVEFGLGADGGSCGAGGSDLLQIDSPSAPARGSA